MTRPYDDDAEQRIASAQAETSRQLLIRIQDLQAEIERLRTALEAIRDNAHMGSRDIRQRAEAALKGGEDGGEAPREVRIYDHISGRYRD